MEVEREACKRDVGISYKDFTPYEISTLRDIVLAFEADQMKKGNKKDNLLSKLGELRSVLSKSNPEETVSMLGGY